MSPKLGGRHPNPRGKGVLLDSNVLLVELVGRLGRGAVEAFKRTRAYTSDDVRGMGDFLSGYSWMCTTPHVITEVSNLLSHMDEQRLPQARYVLAEFIEVTQENFILSTQVVASPVYFKLGITDAALAAIARDSELVLLTDDLKLFHYASNLGVEVVNFNHIRQQWL